MPELRTDWLSGRTVVVAEERAGRPNDFGEIAVGEAAAATGTIHAAVSQAAEATSSACPFCPGQEHRTTNPTYVLKDARGNWRLRVVPNMFPAVTFPAELPAATRLTSASSVESSSPKSVATSPAIGAQEVIIECARHIDRTSALSVAELRDVLEVYVERLRHWRDDGRLQYGLVFKNQGPRAGASLAHLHSQLVALPTAPPTVQAELHRAEQDFGKHRSCPHCRLIQHERTSSERIVFDRDGFVAFCPHASLQPFETWLLPVDHEPAFERPTEVDSLDRLADVLHDLISRVEAIVPDAGYNLILRTAPWLAGVEPWCHWRIELLPRVAIFAGLELATGIHINLLSPEHAAQHLRTVSLFPDRRPKF